MLLLLHVVLSEREVIHSLICGSALDIAESIELFVVRSCELQVTCAAEGSHSKKQSRVCVSLPAHSTTAPCEMALWRLSAAEQCLICMQHPQATAEAQIV